MVLRQQERNSQRISELGPSNFCAVSIFVLQKATFLLLQLFIGAGENCMRFCKYTPQTLLKRSGEEQILKKKISPLNVMAKEESQSQQVLMLAISIQYERPMEKTVFFLFLFLQYLSILVI